MRVLLVQPPRGDLSWGETTRKAHALDAVADLIARYLPPDSKLSREDVIAEIIGIIETRTSRRFIRAVRPLAEDDLD